MTLIRLEAGPAGMSHIFDNITKDILHSLPGFSDFQSTLRTLTDLLSIEHYRSRFLIPIPHSSFLILRIYVDFEKCRFWFWYVFV